MSSAQTPLALAARADKARARAAQLRKQADAYDAKADELHVQFDKAMREMRRRVAAYDESKVKP